MNHPREAKYNKSYEQHGQSPLALQWRDYQSAAVRYKQLVADLDLNGKTILDAGCGMGDLLPYIYAKSDEFDYLGVDPTRVFIDTAQKRYHGHNFKVGDPFVDKLPKSTFDIILCSGVLNANGDNWLAERKQMIARLYSLADEALAFNMAGSFNPQTFRKQSPVAYANIADIVDYCQTLTPKLTLRNHYHRRDFTITLFK